MREVFSHLICFCIFDSQPDAFIKERAGQARRLRAADRATLDIRGGGGGGAGGRVVVESPTPMDLMFSRRRRHNGLLPGNEQ